MTPLERRLAELARAGHSVTYGQLARDLGLRIGVLTAGLEALMEQDAAHGAPLRAALCQGKLSHGLPAPGFFQKCAELGLDVGNPVDFVTAHRNQLFGKAE